MAHPNELVLRDAYAAFSKGDVEGFFKLCTPSIMLHVPGRGLLSGKHTKAQFLAALGPAMQATAGTFREEIVQLAANDTTGCVVVAQQVERDGKTYQWTAVHMYRIEQGKLAEFREYTDDQVTFEQAWRR